MLVAIISDTHNKHDQISVPDADLLVHCGDYSIHGSLVELMQFNKWLGTLPHKRKLVIPGNHDFICEDLPILAKKEMSNATLLIDELIEIDGKRIYGSPWTPKYGKWAFMLPRVEMARIWEKVPENLDLLMTHGPPRRVMDLTVRDNSNVGCVSLLETCQRLAPKHHAFGHIHEGYGETTIAWGYSGITNTHFINAAICTVAYEPTNKPILVEI